MMEKFKFYSLISHIINKNSIIISDYKAISAVIKSEKRNIIYVKPECFNYFHCFTPEKSGSIIAQRLIST